MVKNEINDVTIICDKCKTQCTVNKKNTLELFYFGWVLNSKGRKYKHICPLCVTKKQKESTKFINEMNFKI